MLTICWKQKWNYLQLLVDDYLRDRIEHIDDAQSWKINKWKNNHKHFLKLRQLKLPKNMPSIEGNDNNEQQTSTTNIKLETVDEFVSKSVFLFRDRLCHELSFKKPIYLINDSLEIVIKYIYAGFMLIGNILSESNATKRALTPFQFDLCIASKPPKSNITNDNDDNNNKDDNSSDDEQDETKEDIDTNYIDSVGDIEAKLKQNKLDYYVEKLKARDREKFKEHQRIFTSLFNKFENKYNSNENNKTYYFHKKRFIALVDRRDLKHDGIDDVYMYLAPNGKYTRDIPNDINMIKYWYFSSSRTCLLPNMEYEEKEIIGIDDGIKNNERESQENKLKDANIHSGFPCCGALLTLSFHVSAQDDIQIYLYHNGKFTRFLPNDIETVLPRLFNMEYGESKNHNTNKEYLDKEDLAQTIKGYDELNSKIKDKRFECFRKLNVS